MHDIDIELKVKRTQIQHDNSIIIIIPYYTVFEFRFLISENKNVYLFAMTFGFLNKVKGFGSYRLRKFAHPTSQTQVKLFK